ncbi:transposable element Tc1 transposase [Trichonephila clavipes]|nr:transposable element Tc1 transposase [Trichonephila clavipes]
MAFNVYQRRHVFNHYATLKYDVRCRAGLTLGKNDWFVAFFGSTVVIPPQAKTRFIREQYPKPFDDPGTMTMTLRQPSSPVFSGQCCLFIPRGKHRASLDTVSEFDRGKIAAYRDYELSFREIGQRVGQNQGTVMWIYHRWRQEEMTDQRGRSHPPLCTNARDYRRFVLMATAPTIRRRLQQSGMSERRKLLRLHLTGNHNGWRLRHQWCDERRRVWITEWDDIVFTQEC